MNILKTYNRLNLGKFEYRDEKNQMEYLQPLAQARTRMGKFFQPNQLLGRKGSIGCVSLEISQQCNLDCSLCYLSPNSSNVKDLPLTELFSRLDKIRHHYGVGTNVQISGGDPTLRNRKELMQIVRYARLLGLNPALFTNGILVSRDLLEELVENGLSDVAFHVDMSQKRPGYHSEQELNAVRLEYIERTRGLPLLVVFNTTVFDENFSDIPSVVQFFIDHADRVGFCSFQLQADTGRGVLGKRTLPISLETVRAKIDEGADNALGWDAFLIGHPKCHSYAPALAINGKAFSMVEDPVLVGDFLNDFKHISHDRREQPSGIALKYFRTGLQKPKWIFRGLKHFLPRLWRIRKEIYAEKKLPRKISFFVQNFMDADNLDQERIDACSFTVMTSEGPVSMCAHNARRDDYILKPVTVYEQTGAVTFYPLKKKYLLKTRKSNNLVMEEA